jgi:hypothetical protein
VIYLVGYFIGLVIAAFPAFFLRGLALLARRRWRGGLFNVAGGVGALVFGLLIAGCSFLFARSGWGTEPSEKARYLAEAIAETMNCAAWTALLGIPAGIFLAVSAYRKSAPNQR